MTTIFWPPWGDKNFLKINGNRLYYRYKKYINEGCEVRDIEVIFPGNIIRPLKKLLMDNGLRIQMPKSLHPDGVWNPDAKSQWWESSSRAAE